MAQDFRITYATLSADNEDLQRNYDEAVERARRTLHSQILQALLQEGWEPIGTDANGRVMALRRKLPEAPVADPEAFSWQLTRPWRGD